MKKNRVNSNLYFTEIIKYFPKEHELRYVSLQDGRLYSLKNGYYYPTKLTKEDLPEWYLWGRYYKKWGYLNTKDIKYVKYRPVKIAENHVLRDDCVLISYSDPIIRKMDSDGIDNLVYDEAVWGNEIITVLKGMRDYGGHDIQPYIEEIWQKCLTLKDVDGFNCDSYFDEAIKSRENFDRWWK